MKKILLILAFLSISIAEPWCDAGPFCNASYQCRASIYTNETGILKIENVNFSNLFNSCGISGELDNSSLRVVFNNTLVAHNLTEQSLFFNALEMGQYYLYFSNVSENETRLGPNLSINIEKGIGAGCVKQGVCSNGGLPCPQLVEIAKPIYKVTVTATCEQALHGIYCTVLPLFGDCRCTTGYNEGYATSCSNTCYGNFSNGSHAGVSVATTDYFCSASVSGTFYYLDFDAEKTINSIESITSYLRPPEPLIVSAPQPTIAISGPTYAAPTAAPAIEQSPHLEISILEPKNGTILSSPIIELQARIENNTQIDCSLALDSNETTIYIENNTIYHSFLVSEGEHKIDLICSAGDIKKETQIMFSVEKENISAVALKLIEPTASITSNAPILTNNLYMGIIAFLAATIIISAYRVRAKLQKQKKNPISLAHLQPSDQ